MDQFKAVTLPLYPPGLFDARSSADNQTPGALAWKQNLACSADGKLQTCSGFVKPYDTGNILQTNGVACPYSNADFHDQTPNVTPATREPPTLLYASTANDGTRRLYAGTKTRILLLNESAGSWPDVVGQQAYGQDGNTSQTQVRWHCDQLQDILYLANGYDQVQQTALGSTSAINVVGLQTAGAGGSAIKAPKVIIQYQGVMMLMNVMENNVRVPSRIWWSDLNDGTCWLTGNQVNPNTGTDSIADFQDLTYGQEILGAIVLNGWLYVLTDKAIWQCSFTVTDTGINTGGTTPVEIYQATLQCNQVYSEPENGSRCLFYPNTLVSDGESMYFAGHDAIYRYNMYMAVPERTEWIFRFSNLIYNSELLGAAIDETAPNSPVAQFWPDAKEIHFSWPVPDATLVNPDTCALGTPPATSGLCRNTLVINVQYQTADYREYGMNAYSPWKPTLAIAGQLSMGTIFLGSLTDDFALKVLGVGNARQVFNFSTGQYATNGYYWILRGEFNLDNFQADKEIKAFIIDGTTPATSSNVFSVRLGSSYTNQNINAVNGNCGIVWWQLQTQPIKCLMAMSPAQYAAKGIRPAYAHRFNRLVRGRFIFFEITGKRSDGTPPVDGPATLSRLVCLAIDA